MSGPSVRREWVWSLQWNYSVVRVSQDLSPYSTVSSETPPTCTVRSPYIYSPGTRCPSYISRHWVPFALPLTTSRRYSNPPPHWISVKLQQTVIWPACLVVLPSFGPHDQILITVGHLPFLTWGRVCIVPAQLLLGLASVPQNSWPLSFETGLPFRRL
jgi:hypothetical protein